MLVSGVGVLIYSPENVIIKYVCYFTGSFFLPHGLDDILPVFPKDFCNRGYIKDPLVQHDGYIK